MALLWADGFEGANSGMNEYNTRRYMYFSGSWSVTTGQNGLGQAIYGGYNSLYTPLFPTTDRTLCVGAGFKVIQGSDVWLFELLHPPTAGGGPSTGIGFRCTNNEIRVYRGGSLLWTSSTGQSITQGYWHWLEFKVYCDNSSGIVEVYRGGQQILSETGDTQVGSVNYHNGLYFHNGPNRSLAIDNLYVCDSTGTKNNDRLGPVRITTIVPSEDGDESDWETAPTPGGDHYAVIDDAPSIDDADYLISEAYDDKDLWEYNDASDIGTTIHAVQVVTDARSYYGAPARLHTLAKTGATETSDDGVPLKTQHLQCLRLMEVQPSGLGDWSLSALNAYQFGIEHGEI